jgi:isopentenyl-diphosphate Delta-isomerase
LEETGEALQRTAGDATSPAETVRRRKEEHLKDAQADVESRGGARWEDVQLLHQALPEVDLDAIELSTTFLGRRLGAPIMIASMTGGHPQAGTLNAVLARAAERHGIAMGVGSQRAGLLDASVADSYAVARREAPTAYLIANVGIAQLIEQAGRPALTADEIHTAIDMIGADALAVHLNFLEEVVQPEGDRQAAGCLDAIARLVGDLGGRVPVLVKETGAGIAPATAERLVEAGVSALDVGGRGGTSFAAIEGRRAARRGDAARAGLGVTFRDWGIPTAVSVAAVSGLGVPVVATGGVRSGLDAARAIALGATLVGLARPMLQAAVEGDEALATLLDTLLLELRTALFLTGSARPEQLRRSEPVVLGETAAWLERMPSARTSRA